MEKRRRARKSRKHPDPHVARCSGFLPADQSIGRDLSTSVRNSSSEGVAGRADQSAINAIPTSAPNIGSPDSASSVIPTNVLDKPHRSSLDLVLSDPVHNHLEFQQVTPPSAGPSETNQQITSQNSTVQHSSAAECTRTSPSAEQDEDPDHRSTRPSVTTSFDAFEDDALLDLRNANTFDMFDIPQDEEIEQLGNTSSTRVSQCSRSREVLNLVTSSIPRPTLLGIITLYGKARFTLESYDHLVALMKDGDNSNNLPCATTVRQTIFPKLRSNNFVTSTVHEFNDSDSAKTASYLPQRPKRRNGKKKSAVVVLPSDWAKIDVRSLHVLREIACTNRCRCKRELGQEDLRIESTPIVSERSTLFSKSDYLWVNTNGVPSPAGIGSSIRLHFPSDITLSNKEDFVQFTTTMYKRQMCKAIDGTVLGTEHVVYSSKTSASLQHGLRPSDLDFSQQKLYSHCMPFLHELCRQSVTSNTEDDDGRTSSEGSGSEVCTPQTRRQKRKGAIDKKVDDATLLPGDHLTILSINSPNYVAVLLSRYWVNRLSDERNFTIIVRIDSTIERKPSTLNTIGAPVLLRSTSSNSSSPVRDQTCHTTGYVDGGPHHGKRFYKYRLLLYADDFNARSTLFPKGSVGGFYMSPSSLNVRSRRSQSTVRAISLTPTGISTNLVFDYIIDDIIDGSINGLECKDAFGQHVVVYLEVTGFIGDYPASSAVVDVKGHTASSPCTHCSFPRNILDGSSTYAFTSIVHSLHSAFRRSQSRSSSAHNFGLFEQVAKNIGMKIFGPTGMFEKGKSPLLKFATLFNRRLHSSQVNSVVSNSTLDGYELNVIAPDHLLTGLFKGLLTLCFLHLPCEITRAKLTTLLRTQLLQYGFQTQSILFMKKKLVPGLSMSTLYCIFTLLPAVLYSLGVLPTLPIKSILFNLHRFVSLAFWWPSIENDGTSAWSFVHGDHIRDYHRTLQLIAANTLKAVNKYCKSYPQFSKHIDRPNIHRLVELSTHTLPNYYHVLYICEMVYESSHQPLKFFLSRNHSANGHIYALHSILAKDWMLRLWALWKIHTSDSERKEDRTYALLGLIRLLAGPAADEVDWLSSIAREALEELRQYIHFLFQGTVENRLAKWYADLVITQTLPAKWVPHTPVDYCTITANERYFFDRMISSLQSLSVHNTTSFTAHSTALLDRGFGSATKSYHERLNLGDVIQLLLPVASRGHVFLDNLRSIDGVPHFFVIGGLIKADCGVLWACVKKCTALSTVMSTQIPNFKQDPILQVTMPNFYGSGTETVHFLQLKGDVKKVGVVNDYSSLDHNVFSSDNLIVEQSTNTLDGGKFLLLTRSMGFPPRRS